MLAFWIGAKFCQINRVEPNLYYKKFGSAKMCPRFGTTNILVGFQTKQALCIKLRGCTSLLTTEKYNEKIKHPKLKQFRKKYDQVTNSLSIHFKIQPF